MFKNRFLKEISVIHRNVFIVFILLSNTFIWYSMTLLLIDNLSASLDMSLALRATYYLAAIAFSFLGSLVSESIGKLRILFFWILIGAAVSLLPVLSNNTANYLLVVVSLLGASFGFGMPSCLAYFADSTVVENRGRMGGIIFLAANMSALPLTMLIMKFDLAMCSLTIAIWRGLGLIVLFALRPAEVGGKTGKYVSFSSIFHDRSLILYLVPWLTFSFVDRFEKLIFQDFLEQDLYRFIVMGEPIISAVFAFIGGFLSDRIGRKRIVIYCLILTGLAYAVIGVSPTTLISWYFYALIDGIALGMFWLIFVLILWGDLSQCATREKYYVIGSIPYFLANIMPVFLAPYVTLISPYAAFSFASFFLFLAVLPLMYAIETLPEKKIELRRLRGYVERAKKVRDKYVKS